MDGFYNIQKILELIRLDIITVSGSVIWVGQAIGAIGALLYLAKISYEGLLGGNIWTLRVLRPFGIAILLALYPQFMSVVDGMANAVNSGLATAMRDANDHNVADILKTRDLNPDTDNDDALIGIEDMHSDEPDEVKQTLNGLADDVSNDLSTFGWIGEKFYLAMMRMWEEILFRISHAMLVMINTIRVFFLIVLYITGPLVLGIACIPGFESAFLRWMGRYLSVHLWLGIGSVFEAIAVRLWQIIVDNGGMSTAGLGLEDAVNSAILTQWAWMYLLILIVGYVTIPMVAGWVISGSGLGQAGSIIAATVMKTAGKGIAGRGGGGGGGAARGSFQQQRQLQRYNPKPKNNST